MDCGLCVTNWFSSKVEDLVHWRVMCSDANDSLWGRHTPWNATTAKKNKPAAQNGYVQSLQDMQPRKKQKLDGGRLRHVRCSTTIPVHSL